MRPDLGDSDSTRSDHRSVWLEPFPVEIVDQEQQYVLAAVLPHSTREEIGVSVSRDRVSIAVTDTDHKYTDGPVETTTRTIRLAQPLDGPAATARFDDGVLLVTVPKRQ